MSSIQQAMEVEHLRAKQRVELRLPVLFEWREAGRKHHAPGLTRDVSSGGLYVVSQFCPPLTQITRCHLVLPALHPETKDLVYEAVLIGRIKRIDYEADRQVGFAVHARVMILREPQS